MGWENRAALSGILGSRPWVEPKASSAPDVRSRTPSLCAPGGSPLSFVVRHLAEREHVVSTPPGPRAGDEVDAASVPGLAWTRLLKSPGRPSFMSVSAGLLLLLTSSFDMICSGYWFLSVSEIFFKCI